MGKYNICYIIKMLLMNLVDEIYDYYVMILRYKDKLFCLVLYVFCLFYYFY